ncbi:LGFP repeat-containing protein [Arthrobacter sp. SA17]
MKDQGCSQEFGRLRLVWSAKSGAYGVWTPGGIGTLYTSIGAENGKLGYPTSKEVCGLKANGCYQNYQGGAIVWSPGTGARISEGPMRKNWASRGYENGPLGYPVADVVCGLAGNGCLQEYQGGTIYWSPVVGAHSVNGGIKARFDQQGAIGGYLAYPLENEVCGQPGGGCYQWFQGGLIFWSPTTGSQPIRGGMQAKYASMGWHLGYLGYPATPEVCSGESVCRHFRAVT